MLIRHAYDGLNDTASLESSLVCDPAEDKAQQQFKEECDINTIVERFGLTGQLPQNANVPQSGDFTNIDDYHAALNQVIAADAEFMKFPADIRARFNHDPGEMIAFCDDPANREEAIKLGMIPKPAEVTRDVVTTPAA